MKLKAIVFKDAVGCLTCNPFVFPVRDPACGFACHAIKTVCHNRATKCVPYLEAFAKMFRPEHVRPLMSGYEPAWWDCDGCELEPRYMALLLMYHMVKDGSLP